MNPTPETTHILNLLYNDVLAAHMYLLSLKKQHGNIYNVQTKKIHTASQITKPQNFNFNSFPELVRKHINETAVTELSYTFSLFERNIRVVFTTEDLNVELKIKNYNKYIDSIIIWLHILTQYASKKCASTLTIYLYFTSLEKQLPESNISVLDEYHVNTAFTTTCPTNSEIVVYRKEEWFKVFIHETFHNFGLDFSDMNVSESTNHILSLFPVKSEVNLFESYTEFWGEIMNAILCSFFLLKNKQNKTEFFNSVFALIQYERIYSFFQMVKTLKFMGLTYTDIYKNSLSSRILRENMYKERTNILSYYVIKTILLNNYAGFLSWCNKNNFSILQFKKTPQNLKSFCLFIENNYKKPGMISNVKNTERHLQIIKQQIKKQELYLLRNMRMSICEMG